MGSKRVEATSRPGLDKAFTEKTPSTSAMQEPAPTIAASSEAAITSFNRIPARFLILMLVCKCSSLDWWEKGAAKDTTGTDHK